tara:strand:+ start:70 stop:855 length:786 start_codon:yes stop_codon:yes gene_type:complete
MKKTKLFYHLSKAQGLNLKLNSYTMKKLYAFLLIIIGGSASINAQCDHTLTLTDAWGDGWTGATVDLTIDGTTLLAGIEAAGGAGGGTATTEDLVFSASTGNVIALENWVAGSTPAWDVEIGWSIADGDGVVIASGVWGDLGTGSGYCAPAAATCTDGIQNGDETGIDCGGATCPPCSFVGLNEISVESLNVYPNPASSEITVSINESMIDNQIVILDQMGKVVLKVVVLNLNTTINVSSLSNGLYYVKVGENTFSKFIKN